MSAMLDRLYDGKLCPHNDVLAEALNTPQYRQLLSELAKRTRQLENSLDEELQTQFSAYRELQSMLDQIEQEKLFTYAFRLGAQMMTDVFLPHETKEQPKK